MLATLRYFDGGGTRRVNFVALDAAVDDIRVAVTAMNATIDELNTKLVYLLELRIGGAHEQYVSTQTNWNNAAAAIEAALNKVSTAVDNAKVSFMATEARAQQTLTLGKS